jgi:hypothetical protein
MDRFHELTETLDQIVADTKRHQSDSEALTKEAAEGVAEVRRFNEKKQHVNDRAAYSLEKFAAVIPQSHPNTVTINDIREFVKIAREKKKMTSSATLYIAGGIAGSMVGASTGKERAKQAWRKANPAKVKAVLAKYEKVIKASKNLQQLEKGVRGVKIPKGYLEAARRGKFRGRVGGAAAGLGAGHIYSKLRGA